MMPSVVLGDQRIQRIHRHEPAVYQEYKTLEIDSKPILDYLQEFYGDRKTFDDFLRKSWDFICKYGLEIKEKLGRK